MQNRWLMLMPAIAVATPAAAQNLDAEMAALGCKNAAIEEVVRSGGRTVSVVRFPPGALVWVTKEKESRVQGPGQYRLGPDDWRDFIYACAYDHATARTRIRVQRAEVRAATASQAGRLPMPMPLPEPAPRAPRRR